MSDGDTTLLTKADVARELCVSVRTVERLMARKLIRVVDIGHRTKRFRPVDVERTKDKLAG